MVSWVPSNRSASVLLHLFPAGVNRQQMNMTFKSVVREKRCGPACIKVSAFLFAGRNPNCIINFWNIGKYEAQFLSTYYFI
jgi:hypothetical protein